MLKSCQESFDEKVAGLMVMGLEASFIKLTNEQREYIGLQEGGQKKDDTYRY